MSRVAIYMEGGGNTATTKAALRQGMDAFLTELKDSVRSRSWHWKLVCCGGRDQAYNAFRNAHQNGDATIIVLLVDAESQVNSEPCTHLAARDGWDLKGIPADYVHLMAQTMEAWIVADRDTLQAYYGQHFKGNALPEAANLEAVAKVRVASALDKATVATQKGTYHKIRHASDLLKKIAPHLVRQRCPGCDRLFVTLGKMIEEA